MFQADEGYFFGIGAFETVAVEQGIPMFFEEHYARLLRAAEFLRLTVPVAELRRRTEDALQDPQMKRGRKVLKMTVSEKNIIIAARENSYRKEDYARGFTVDLSRVRRNETSPFTYHKTLNYGDCLFEKRRAKEQGIDEPVFLNMKGELCEGATTNLFFVRDGELFTPPVSSGLLPGIMRGYVMANYPAKERVILPGEITDFDEMFLTNSLLGVMPVVKFGTHLFSSRETGDQIRMQLKDLTFLTLTS